MTIATLPNAASQTDRESLALDAPTVASISHDLANQVSLDGYDGWQSFELIPTSFRNAREARSVLIAWIIMTTFLLAFFLGSLVALFFRGQAIRQRNAELIASAKPLKNLRSEVALLKQQSQTIARWGRTVSTAKPDDSLLQVLANVAHATHPNEPVEVDDHLEVQSLHVKLALEHSGGDDKVPTWAEPRFTISALANKRASVTQWSGRLAGIDRLDHLEVKAPSAFFRETLVQATAIPRSTRILP
ncbi:MAG: hypothetical protein AAFU85_29580 [Planctomycetota bacterium]